MMNSIDNLREYVLTAPSICSTTRAILVGYVDEIGREVKELADERDLLKTQWEAGVDFDQRLAAAAEGRIDVTLFGVDYTAMPLDADGVPIHVGDWITGKWDAKAKVVAITSEDVYWWEPDGCHWCHAYEVRHHHAPTVEDVLREFAEKMNENLGMYTGEAIDADEWRKADERTIAEYAARLRLAEGVDE